VKIFEFPKQNLRKKNLDRKKGALKNILEKKERKLKLQKWKVLIGSTNK